MQASRNIFVFISILVAGITARGEVVCQNGRNITPDPDRTVVEETKRLAKIENPVFDLAYNSATKKCGPGRT